jgi:hypothetical protein
MTLLLFVAVVVSLPSATLGGGCIAGQYDSAAGGCEVCAADTYSVSIGSHECKACPAGKHSSGTAPAAHDSPLDCIATERTVSDSLDIGVNLPPLTADGFVFDISDDPSWLTTNTRTFKDLMKVSTSFKETRGHSVPEAGVQVAAFDEVTGRKTTDWVHYNIPAEVYPTFTRNDGYPDHLASIDGYWGQKRISAVAHIGKGGAYVKAGVYICMYMGQPGAARPGEGLNATTGAPAPVSPLRFEKDAAEVSFDATRQRYEVRVEHPEAGILIRIISTDPSEPIHGITFVPAEFEASDLVAEPFHPEFLARLAGTHVLRFAGWQLPNRLGDRTGIVHGNGCVYGESPCPQDWSARPLTTDQTQAGSMGVALEYMIQLANTLGASVWFSQPDTDEGTKGVDAYIRAFAGMVLRDLHDKAKVYVNARVAT